MSLPNTMTTDASITHHIDIGRDFSLILGPHSGELFLEKFLEPAFIEANVVVISLDAIELPSTSFFEEAFGGLVRKYDLPSVEKKLRFNAVKKAYLVPKIRAWMSKASTAR